ncbi:MAG TPA: nucleotide exchange factor GrpE [Sedimentisphaerales bacterium]|nr:nucleotide exchange factor GrpE [Sedimentisphaerales bacterium]HRS10986.1 nucleotide exchange factor GrpE [Sedimentisphaerales bacterium]HRV48680.1 nucleotide exchange factor GrpE [Sedimentisphaerales bacterium]
MLKKCVILGLVLLLAGGLSLAWVRQQAKAERLEVPAGVPKQALQPADYFQKYGNWHRLTAEEQNQLVLELDKERQNKTPEELAAEQRAHLHSDLPKLAAGEMNPGDIADYLYGPNWEEQVTQYRQRREKEQIAQTTSIVCLSIGGTLFGVCFIVWVLRSIVRAFRAIARRRADRAVAVAPASGELTDIPHEGADEQGGGEKDSDVPAESSDDGDDGPEFALSSNEYDSKPTDDNDGERFLVPRRHRTLSPGRPTLCVAPRCEEDGVAVLMSDEPSGEQDWSPQMEWTTSNDEDSETAAVPQKQRFTPRPRVAVLGATEIVSAPPPAAPAASPLTEQAEELQRQIAEFRQMAQNVQQVSRGQAEPLGETLKELAQQVSAIREYAACQQDRVEKLQDGYDWSIIRTFCLKVIRCIDNLENRLAKLDENDQSTLQLEEVRDELLFALESSGVEQFRPDIGSDYRGHEKFAEAIKEKEITGDASQVGTIAKVVRPGYRYITDEDNYKVVRTAQVKLFG